MPVLINVNEDMLTAQLIGEIDHHMAGRLREQIDHACQSNQPRLLVLDFMEVSFMDSSGIGLIMGRYKLMQELGGELKVVNIPAYLKKVMKLSGLEKLKIFENGGN